MVATKTDIREWFERGVEKGATHMIVVCDTFDWEDYPVYVMSDQDARKEMTKHHGSNMQKVMEVYNFALPLEDQLAEFRAFNY